LNCLLDEFQGISESHESRLANDQARWELYGKIVLLLRRGSCSRKDVQSDHLKPLHVSRNKLSEVLKYVGQGDVPAVCPAPFRSGRSPELRLTETDAAFASQALFLLIPFISCLVSLCIKNYMKHDK
jgi:hypothetical protein